MYSTGADAPDQDVPTRNRLQASHGMGEALQGKARYEWERSLLRSGVPAGPNHVLLALLRYAGGKAECWPSNDALALDTGLSVRQVRRHVGELARLGVAVVEADRSLKTQRRITFPSHPHSGCKGGSRVDIHVPPAMSEGRTWKVSAGGTPMSSEPELETPEGDGDDVDGERGGVGVAGGEILEGAAAFASLEPMASEDAMRRVAVRAWVRSAFNAMACGMECETVEALVRIAAGKDEARLGLSLDDIERRARWIDGALCDLRPPDWPYGFAADDAEES